MNYAEPAVQPDLTSDVEVTKDGRTVVHHPRGGAAAKAPDPAVVAKSAQLDRKLAAGNPAAARGLAKLEAEAVRTGKSPKQLKAARYKQATSTQQAKLLTILVEFDENADDDFSDQYVPTYWGSDTCKPGNVQNGPLHNNIPNPATLGLSDNNSMWVPDFSSEHFNKMLYTDTGITERVRTDLTGPDGKPGFDISGYTMKKMYEEMSHRAYTVTGEATPWVKVPHSEAWYGAQRCYQDEDGNWVAGAYQTMNGHPDNPRGPGQLPIDAVAALAQASRTSPTGTGTATSTSLTASSTTSCSSTPARTSPAAAARRAPTPSGRTPPRSPGARRCRVTTSTCRTTSSSPRTPVWACSPTSTATTSACPTSTTSAAPASPTSTSGT
jgi:immune inhibitor A